MTTCRWLLGVALAGFASTMVAAPVQESLVRNGSSFVFTAKSQATAAFDQAKSMQVKPYVLDGEFETLPELSCIELFELVRIKAYGDFPSDNGRFTGVASCSRSSDDEDSPALSFSYSYVFEAKSDADLPVFMEFIASHQGTDAEGEVLNYRPAFGIYAAGETSLFDEFPSDGEFDSPFEKIKVQRFFASMGHLDSWEEKATAAVEGDAMSFLAWVRKELGEGSVQYYRESILPRSVAIYGEAACSIILEDRTLVRYPVGVTMGYRDCRESASGKCI